MLGVTAFTKLSAVMKTVAVTQFMDNLTALIGIFTTATASTNAFSGAMAVLNAVMEVNPLILIATAIAGVVSVTKLAIEAFDYFNITAEESREALSDLRKETEESDNAIKSLRTEIQETNDKIKELKQQKLELTNEKDKQRIDEELIGLEAQSAELRTQLRIQEQINAEKHKDEEVQATESAKKSEETFSYASSSGGYWESIEGTAQEQMEQTIQKYSEYSNKIKDINTQLIQANKDKDDALVQSLSDEKAYYEDANIQLKSHMTDLADIMMTQNESIYGVTEAGKSLKDSNNELLQSYETLLGLEENGIDINQDLSAQYEELSSQIVGGKDAIEEYAEANGYLDDLTAGTEEYTAALIEAGLALQEESNQTSDYVEKLSNVSENLESLAKEYNSLKTAVDDFNNGNTLSLESLDTLITAVMNHSNALSYDNGQLVLSEKYYEDLANAQIDEAEATLMAKAQDELASIAAGNYADILASVTTASNSAASASTKAGNAAYTAGQNASEGAKGFREFWAAVQGEDYKYVSNHNQFLAKKVVEENTRIAYESLESLRGKFTETSSEVTKSSKSAASSSKDAWLEAYKAEKDALDSLYKTGVINAEEYAVKLQALADKYLLDSAEHQKKYAEQIHSLYEEIYKSLQKSAKDALDEMKDTHKKAEDSLKSQHEEQEKAIKRQIELLKRQKDAIKDSYDAQIEALKREREEYENQIKLMKLKEELAKAEQTYQYVMDESGRFNWVKDQKAVDEKQEELYEEKLKQSYERQLQVLEDARDTAVKQYEQQIQDLEDYYDRVKDANDRAEEQLKTHNDEIEKLYEKATSDYETYATMLANGQLDTIANENSNWATRLNNLANFVNSYNALMNKLGDGSTGNSANASLKGGTAYSSGQSGGSTKAKADGVKYSNGSFSLADKAKIRASLGKHASGIASIDSDEMALVGDSPNQELVIGSKLNGIPLSLNAGSGVVNAKSTKTFAGLLNSLPKLSNNYSTTNTSNQQVIHVDNINLPQVTNGEEFIDYLQNFDIDMIQRSF